MNNTYNCQIFYGMKMFMYSLLTACIFLVLVFYIGILIRFPYFGAICFVILCIIPFIFQKKIKQLFTKQVNIKFEPDGFTIVTFSINNKERKRERVYQWDKIKGYKFYFTPNKLTVLDIYFKDGLMKEFPFKENKTLDESINNESVYRLFLNHIKSYNKDKESKEKIALRPPLLTTQTGTWLLIIVGVLAAVAIMLTLIKGAKNLPFLLIGIFIYLPLLAKRSQDKKFYEKMKKGDFKSNNHEG